VNKRFVFRDIIGLSNFKTSFLNELKQAGEHDVPPPDSPARNAFAIKVAEHLGLPQPSMNELDGKTLFPKLRSAKKEFAEVPTLR
jgi:hypothetical protein